MCRSAAAVAYQQALHLPGAWRGAACLPCCCRRTGGVRAGAAAPGSRALSTTPAAASGHNRWSKIRHDKGAADAKKTAVRSGFTRSLTLYSQMYGPDPANNPQLASVIANAKKAGVPKTVIEAAIARGQGRSADGGKLEVFTYEISIPPGVALIVDLETESKARALQDLNALMRRRGAAIKSTKFFFARRGRVVFGSEDADAAETDAASTAAAAAAAETAAGPLETQVTADDILEDAIEAGAEDVETEDDGSIVVWTPANQTAAVVEAVAKKHGLAVLSADTIWAANEDTRALVGGSTDQPTSDLRRLLDLLTALRAYPDVKAIYANAAQGEDVSDADWQQVAQELDW